MENTETEVSECAEPAFLSFHSLHELFHMYGQPDYNVSCSSECEHEHNETQQQSTANMIAAFMTDE